MEIARVAYITIDSVDPERLAPFWAQLLGVEVESRVAGDQYILLGRTAEGMPAVAFQKVPEEKGGKTRIHLDLAVLDLDTATARIEEIGGRWLEPGLTRDVDGYLWRCMADPEGNEFDIAAAQPA